MDVAKRLESTQEVYALGFIVIRTYHYLEKCETLDALYNDEGLMMKKNVWNFKERNRRCKSSFSWFSVPVYCAAWFETPMKLDPELLEKDGFDAGKDILLDLTHATPLKACSLEHSILYHETANNITRYDEFERILQDNFGLQGMRVVPFFKTWHPYFAVLVSRGAAPFDFFLGDS